MSFERLHLHPVAALMSSLKLLGDLLLPFIVFLVTIFRGKTPDSMFIWEAVGGGTVLLLVFVWGLISWRRFTYHVETGALRVEEGVFVRKRKIIPMERIQTIDLIQGVLHRVCGVVSVEIQTAGGHEPEAVLKAVSIKDAELLRRSLLINREPVTSNPVAASKRMKTLSNRELLIFGLTSGGSLGIAFSTLSGSLAMLTELNDLIFSIDVKNFLYRIWGSPYGMILAVVAGIILWVLSLGVVAAPFGGFTITRTGDSLHVVQGFLKRRQASIPIKRIQAVRLIEGALRQPFGYVTLHVESAGYAMESAQKSILWPLLSRKQVKAFLQTYLPEFEGEFELKSLPAAARGRYAVKLLIPLAVLVIPLSLLFPWGKYALSLLPLSFLWGLLRYRDAGWGINGNMLSIRSRSFNRTTAFIPGRCIQSFTLTQSLFQRRPGLASFDIGVASGVGFGLAHIFKLDGDNLMEWSGKWTFCGRAQTGLTSTSNSHSGSLTTSKQGAIYSGPL